MDPDDPRTYQSGSFDLSSSRKQASSRIPFFDRISAYLNSNKDIRFIIPILLFLILLLNVLKIYYTAPENDNIEKEIHDIFPSPPLEDQKPEDKLNGVNPSLEI